MVLLKVIGGLRTLLICAEGARLLLRGRDRGDPADALASRRLPEPPAESEAPGAQINSLVDTAK
jgi:hypothetical protein